MLAVCAVLQSGVVPPLFNTVGWVEILRVESTALEQRCQLRQPFLDELSTVLAKAGTSEFVSPPLCMLSLSLSGYLKSGSDATVLFQEAF